MYGLAREAVVSVASVSFPDVQDKLTTDGHATYRGCIRRHKDCRYLATIADLLRFGRFLNWLHNGPDLNSTKNAD